MVFDLSDHRGIGQFGRAYQIMLENDSHAPGSVDRVLAENMIRLNPETAPHLYEEYTPTNVEYLKGSRPELEKYVDQAIAECVSPDANIAGITMFSSGLSEKVLDQTYEEMRSGGIEEEIIRRGSDWCTDVARVGCVLYQVAGLPARLVMLFDTDKAYSGHVMVEVYRDRVWGAVDTLTYVIYQNRDGRPASTWELMNHPELIEAHCRGETTPYTTSEQFRGAAISNYFVWHWRKYNYTTSRINDYYRSILEMSDRKWPGGLRWLHDEDQS